MKKTHSITVGYLAWIFGFTGLHRFYFGKPISGTIWALTMGLLGIGWIIDLFFIPAMHEEAHQKYRIGRIHYSVGFALHFFLGLLGVHRLYMGKILTGIIFLLSGGLFGIGWIYDLLTLNTQISKLNSST